MIELIPQKLVQKQGAQSNNSFNFKLQRKVTLWHFNQVDIPLKRLLVLDSIIV